MKELLQQHIKKSNREELDELYNYVKNGDLLEFIQGEIIFRNDVSLEQQHIRIGDCFIKQIDNEYLLCRIDMIYENSEYVDCTELMISPNSTLDTWDAEKAKRDLIINWKSLDTNKFNQIMDLVNSADTQIINIQKLTLEMILKLINDENT